MFKLGSRVTRVTPIHDTDDWYGTRPDRIKDARRYWRNQKKCKCYYLSKIRMYMLYLCICVLHVRKLVLGGP